mmetsp:Transcript_25708/g.102587  ORF Transcript_25708/g.102587 Transcript_25708/m.102587 type:complete len:273 (+) Transcript_25708:689-1507(+)
MDRRRLVRRRVALLQHGGLRLGRRRLLRVDVYGRGVRLDGLAVRVPRPGVARVRSARAGAPRAARLRDLGGRQPHGVRPLLRRGRRRHRRRVVRRDAPGLRRRGLVVSLRRVLRRRADARRALLARPGLRALLEPPRPAPRERLGPVGVLVLGRRAHRRRRRGRARPVQLWPVGRRALLERERARLRGGVDLRHGHDRRGVRRLVAGHRVRGPRRRGAPRRAWRRDGDAARRAHVGRAALRRGAGLLRGLCVERLARRGGRLGARPPRLVGR